MKSAKRGKVGSSFDSFLKAEGVYAVTQSIAIARVLALRAKAPAAR